MNSLKFLAKCYIHVMSRDEETHASFKRDKDTKVTGTVLAHQSLPP